MLKALHFVLALGVFVVHGLMPVSSVAQDGFRRVPPSQVPTLLSTQKYRCEKDRYETVVQYIERIETREYASMCGFIVDIPINRGENWDTSYNPEAATMSYKYSMTAFASRRGSYDFQFRGVPVLKADSKSFDEPRCAQEFSFVMSQDKARKSEELLVLRTFFLATGYNHPSLPTDEEVGYNGDVFGIMRRVEFIRLAPFETFAAFTLSDGCKPIQIER